MASVQALIQEYSPVFDVRKGLKPMKGEPMSLSIRDDIKVTPFRALQARQTPIHQRGEAESETQRLIDAGVIRRASAATPWLLHGFFVSKPDKSLRLVFDARPINQVINRPAHPFMGTDEILKSIPADTKVFITLDAVKGYFQIPLSESAQNMLTMLLPSGAYSFLRAPMGCNASSDEWCRRSDAALRGVPHLLKIVDDILIAAPSTAAALSTLELVLQRCQEHHITLSNKKIQAGKTVKFVGHILTVTDTGVQIRADPERKAALAEFPRPDNITSLRSFLGLAQQFSRFNPDLAHMATPLHQLSKLRAAFTWLPEHEEAFIKIKQVLTSDAAIYPFTPGAETTLYTDASRLRGLGYILTQRLPEENKTRVIECGSISLTSAQQNYSSTEIECLGVQWALQKCRYHLLGAPTFKVVTDHRALVPLLNKKSLQEIPNARLQRLIEKTRDFDLVCVWEAGKNLHIVDALSRHPVFEPEDRASEVDLTHNAQCNSIHINPGLDRLSQLAKEDRDYQEVIQAWKKDAVIKKLPHTHPAMRYKQVWQELSLHNNLLMWGQCIIIPDAAKAYILGVMHMAHPGLPKMKETTRQRYWWPNMNTNLEQCCTTCDLCQRFQKAQPAEPLLPTKATKPFEMASCDMLTNNGKKHLCLTDRYSGFLFVSPPLASETPKAAIDFIMACSAVPGYPKFIKTDSGPQFKTEFETWARSHNIEPLKSCPNATWTNGHAEAGIANAQMLLKKNGGVYNNLFKEKLIEFNANPREDGLSPSAMFDGRVTRSLLPAPEAVYYTIDQEAAASARQRRADISRRHHDKHAHPLPPLNIGQKVVTLIRDKSWSTQGTVTQILPVAEGEERSYIISMANGATLRRNRRHLRPDLASQHIPQQSTQPTTAAPRRSARLQTKQR